MAEVISLNGRVAADHSWQPHSLIQLAENPPEPPTIGGLLYPGKRTVLSGETESMKTWMALILCKAELDIGLTVAWVDLDAMGPGAMLERLQLLGVDDEAIDDRFFYYEPSDSLTDDHLAEVTTTIKEHRIRLVVIDAFNPILSLQDLKPESTPDIEYFWRTYADPICRAGAAPVLLDHVTKNAETRGKYSYGSERKASGAIVHIGFKILEAPTRGGRGRSLLTVHKDRPGILPRPTLGRLVLDATSDTITYHIEPDKSHDPEGGFRPTVLMQKISEELEKQTTPQSQTWIEDNVTGNREAKRTAVKVLAEDAYLIAKPGPRNSTLYTSLRPYREAEEPENPTAPSLRPHHALDLRSISPHDPAQDAPLEGRLARSEVDMAEYPAQTPPGTVIHEYDFLPIDEGQADTLDDL